MDDHRCEDCRHSVPDPKSKGNLAVIFSYCGHPQTRDGKVMRFCVTQRRPYGLCPGGKLFEAKSVGITY